MTGPCPVPWPWPLPLSLSLSPDSRVRATGQGEGQGQEEKQRQPVPVPGPVLCPWPCCPCPCLVAMALLSLSLPLSCACPCPCPWLEGRACAGSPKHCNPLRTLIRFASGSAIRYLPLPLSLLLRSYRSSSTHTNSISPPQRPPFLVNNCEGNVGTRFLPVVDLPPIVP